jgi:hypothetical protein
MDLWVFLYSNFSPNCKELFNIISDNNIDIPFTMLCIDDKNLRDRIKKSKQFSINCVPCILKINQTTGVVSQYEGAKAFELVINMLEQEEIPVMNKQSKIETKSTPKEITYTTNIEDIFGDQDEIEDEVTEDEIKEEAIKSPLKKKISPKDLEDIKREREKEDLKLPSFNKAGINLGSGAPTPIESKKTGSPISVAEVMARVNK